MEEDLIAKAGFREDRLLSRRSLGGIEGLGRGWMDWDERIREEYCFLRGPPWIRKARGRQLRGSAGQNSEESSTHTFNRTSTEPELIRDKGKCGPDTVIRGSKSRSREP